MTAPDKATFDLLAQPWITIIDMDGERREVGLVRLLLEAHRIRRIIGDTPPMTAALHRLVLALLHRAYGPPTEQAWAELWSAPQMPAQPLDHYLTGLRDRFDLFHPQRPFLQCAALRPLTVSSVAKLVPHRAVGNNVTLFDHTTSGDHMRLHPAEAARWLVTAQAFDPGGMKTPFEKVKSSKRAPCNWLGVVLVEGDTLKETLLLNALVYHPDDEQPPMTTPHDLPAWEEPTAPPGHPDKRTPRGWTDLLTWPSRRILLSIDTVEGIPVEGIPMVDGVVVTPGAEAESSVTEDEKMAAFRQPRAANGKPRPGAPLLPVRLSPLRGIWRHSVELLLTDVWEEGRSRQRPATLDQISDLAEHRRIPENAIYTLRVFGQQLDKNASVVEAYLEDVVPAPVALLRARDETLGALIGSAIALADDAGAALRYMEREYLKDKRAEPTSLLDLAYWPRLTAPFSELLIGLALAHTDGASEATVLKAWAKHVVTIAIGAADRWAEGSPADARDLLVIGKHHVTFTRRLDKLVRTFHAETAKYQTREEVA